MRSRVVLASLAAASTALAACGWLLPDGVLETAESDAAALQEDSGSASDSSNADTGLPASDAGVDSGVIVDAGDPQWGEPVVLRESSTGTLCVRRGLYPDAGEIYFGEGNQIYYAENASADAQSITYAEGGAVLNGFSPAPAFVLGLPAIAFQTVFGMFVSITLNKTSVTTPLVLDAGLVVLSPYSPKSKILYFNDTTSIYRWESGTSTKVVFVGRDTTPALSIQRYPVVNANETVIYFTEGLSEQIWTARRLNQSGTITFVDAHPVFPTWTTRNTPTEVSEDGKELIFTREGLDGGSTSYLVKQL